MPGMVCGGRIDQLFGLAQVEQRGDAACLARPGQLQRFLARLQSTLRDLERVVELAQREVGGGHVADQRGDDGLAVFLRAQQVRARRFGRAPQPAPDVDFKRQQLQRGRSEIAILRGQKLRRYRRGAVAREAIDLHAAAGAEIRKLIRARDSKAGARLFDARDGIAQIVVPLQRRANQLLQLFVLEDFEPFEVGDGSGLLRRQRRRAREKSPEPQPWDACSSDRPHNPPRGAQSGSGTIRLRMVSLLLRARAVAEAAVHSGAHALPKPFRPGRRSRGPGRCRSRSPPPCRRSPWCP